MKEVIVLKQQIIEDQSILPYLNEHGIRYIHRQVETRKCANCNKEFIIKSNNLHNEKKFCSLECRTRFNAKIAYDLRLKFNEEYKRKRKEYFEVWRKENREHFNDLCRERNRIYQREKREKIRGNEK